MLCVCILCVHVLCVVCAGVQYEVPTTEQQIGVSSLFYVHKHTQCPLSSKDALSMLLHIIENPDGGANLNLAKLVAKKHINVGGPVVPSLRGCVCGGNAATFTPADPLHASATCGLPGQKYFVLHDKRRDILFESWYKWTSWPWQQPVHEIRSYFVRGRVFVVVSRLCARRVTARVCSQLTSAACQRCTCTCVACVALYREKKSRCTSLS